MPLQHITIPRGPIQLAADLHLPPGTDGSAPRRAVVLSTPGSSVKEQIGAHYARRLADRGIAALVLDPAHQGRSGGEPRDLEDPYRRGEDISYALDALDTTAGIDPRRIGVLGICAGGGYAVHTARTDHRIRAVGVVVPVDIGTAFRDFASDGPGAALDAMADARSAENHAGDLTREVAPRRRRGGRRARSGRHRHDAGDPVLPHRTGRERVLDEPSPRAGDSCSSGTTRSTWSTRS